MHRQALALRRKLYGDQSEITLDSSMKLGRALMEESEPEMAESEKLFREEIRNPPGILSRQSSSALQRMEVPVLRTGPAEEIRRCL